MNFDKINFVLDVLSSETILSGVQNYIKLFIKDSIGDTEILQVEYKISMKDGRNTSDIIEEWTTLLSSGTFYETSFTPTLSKNSQLELAIRITDTNGNKYFLSSNLEGVVR